LKQFGLVLAAAMLVGCTPLQNGTAMTTVIPAPVTRVDGDGSFAISATTTIGGEPTIAGYLAGVLRPMTGFALPVGEHGDIELAIGSAPAPGGYSLAVTPASIRIEGDDAAGLFAGVQTLLQLEHDGAVPSVAIEDYPRFEYRGVMLDVARHFFTVEQVERYIDDIAMLKFNYLHLHLTDDQGWRLAIDSWPELTGVGAFTQVGGGGGGHYTKDDYRAIVAYAASRHITVVPEIDMPGHTNAAIAAYAELGDAPAAPYEGIDVGFSSLAIGSETTYRFVDDVVREVAALTPGPYIHLGGDESHSTTDADFLTFIKRATQIASHYGKTIIGWHEMGRSTELPPGTIGQYWSFTTPQNGAAEQTLSFVRQGGKVIMSPADVAYLDMKYDEHSPLGLVWANGPTALPEAYDWDPAAIIPGIGDDQLLGVEAPVWTETIATTDDLESMAFPRIAAIAEIAWSPAGPRSFAEFAPRLAAFGTRLDAAGIRFYRAPEVTWLD
jgi:hexosaminidase